MKLFISFFFRGLLYTVPITIIVYIIYNIFMLIGEGLNSYGFTIHPAVDPFIGLFALIFLIILIGILGSTLLFKPLFLGVESVIEKAPVINTFYTSIKDLMTALVGSKKKFNQPVLVKLSNDMSVEKLGFVTRENLSVLNISSDKVAVYLPHSFNFSGNLIIVPRTSITSLNASSADVVKFIVSGGVAEIGKE